MFISVLHLLYHLNIVINVNLELYFQKRHSFDIKVNYRAFSCLAMAYKQWLIKRGRFVTTRHRGAQCKWVGLNFAHRMMCFFIVFYIGTVQSDSAGTLPCITMACNPPSKQPVERLQSGLISPESTPMRVDKERLAWQATAN